MRNNRTGETGPPTFRLGDQQMYWSPNFLAVVFKKQEISQQVHHNAGFSIWVFQKKFRVIPRPLTAGGGDPLPHGRPPPAPNTQPGLWPGAGRKRPGFGTQTLVSLNFSAVVAPLLKPPFSSSRGRYSVHRWSELCLALFFVRPRNSIQSSVVGKSRLACTNVSKDHCEKFEQTAWMSQCGIFIVICELHSPVPWLMSLKLGLCYIVFWRFGCILQ